MVKEELMRKFLPEMNHGLGGCITYEKKHIDRKRHRLCEGLAHMVAFLSAFWEGVKKMGKETHIARVPLRTEPVLSNAHGHFFSETTHFLLER